MNAVWTALSGMNAASLELDVSANNVANISTPGFQPSVVELSPRPNGGVVARIGGGPPPPTPQVSGTDPITETATLIVAPLQYAANARVVTASEQMTESLFDAYA